MVNSFMNCVLAIQKKTVLLFFLNALQMQIILLSLSQSHKHAEICKENKT